MRRLTCLTWLVILLLSYASCSKHNPASCCTTQKQCSSQGLEQIYPCASGNVCDTNGTCVVGDCNTAGDCGTTTPFCIGQACAAACTSNNDCAADAAHPLCEPDGSCGACITSASCPANAPICTSDAHECVACETGANCASDVCDVAAGSCVDEADILYVSDQGANTGTCTRNAACRSVGFATSVAAARTRVHILGANYTVPLDSGQATIFLTHTITRIDAANTKIVNNASAPIFTEAGGETPVVTLESMTIGGPGSGKSISVSMSNVTARSTTLITPFAVGSGASFVLATSTLDATSPSSTAGTTTIQDCNVRSEIDVTAGAMTYLRNTFTATIAKAITITSGIANVKNSIFVSNGMTGPVVDFSGGNGGSSSVEFSTFVSLQPTSHVPVTCLDPNVHVTNSVDAWNNVSSSCMTNYVLFSGAAGSVSGTGNLARNVASFFVDLAGQNFHLAAGSPALHGANPSSTSTDDHDGAPRPNPTGSAPDLGAYESAN